MSSDARERLKANPWIADATVLKLYPGELQIGIKEREAFALWQKDGRVSVIADDGTVLDTVSSPGDVAPAAGGRRGAQTQAKAFLALLDAHPAIREQVRAAVLVGERRWNLRLKNGIDVRLPETGAEAALDRLVDLDRDNNSDRPRHRRRRSAACRPRHGAAVGCGRGGPRRGAQGEEGKKKGRAHEHAPARVSRRR